MTAAWIQPQLDMFDQYLLQEGKSWQTRRGYLSDVEQFLLAATKAGADNRHPKFTHLAAEWLNRERPNVSTATAQRRRASLKAYFRLLYDCDPLVRYKLPPAPYGEAHPLPNLMADVRAMLAVTSGQARVAIALCGMAGLRITEARDLRWDDVMWQMGGCCQLRVIGKGGKTRYVPVAPELQAILWEAFKENDDLGLAKRNDVINMSDRHIRRVITQAGIDAEISRPVSSHDLRMTFGTVVYDKTKDLRVTQELLGHSDPKTTERYTGIREAAKRAAVEAAI